MEVLKGLLFFTVIISLGYGQHCSNFTLQNAVAFLRGHLQSGDSNTDVQLSVTNWTINCLATSGQPGKYSSVTFTSNVTRLNDGHVFLGQTDISCLNNLNIWDTTGTYDGLTTQEYNTSINSPLRMDCHICAAGLADDPVTNCASCNSACDRGLGFCTNSGSQHCCSYFNNTNCVSQCGTNSHPNETNFCVCDNFYTGLDCSTCSIQCSNGGVRNLTSCSCDCESTGYNGSTCSQDINECSLSTDLCLNDGTCNNNNGGYTCTCANGYTGSNCSIDINDCDPNPCNNSGRCTDGVNSYSCECMPGYTGTNCDDDIDECQSRPCQNGGTCTQDVVNSYTCSCNSGYTGTDCETNINECTASRTSPCFNGGACVDTDGSFTCTCQGGWIGDLCTTCNISRECTRPFCDGSLTRCDQCITGYSVVNGTCVTCNVKDCTTCTSKDKCGTCSDNRLPSDDGSTCLPPIVTVPPTRGRASGINSGAIIGIVAAFIIVLIIIVIVIGVVIVVLAKVNREKPPTYNVKTPKPDDKDIILTKISNI